MTIEKRNKLEDGAAYDQAETALCIWEHVLDSIPRGRRTDEHPLFRWMAQEEGAYAARANAIRLAHLVDHAYEKAHGEEYHLDGFAFDWEVVPFVIDTWMEMYDHPDYIDIEDAEKMAFALRAWAKQRQPEQTDE